MIKNKLHTVFFILILLVTSSCLKLGLNFKYVTPKKASRVPKFTVSDSLKGSLNPSRVCYDVNFYDIDVKIDPVLKTISGEVSIFFIMKRNSKQIQLDLDPQFKIEKIEQGSKSLMFSRMKTAVLIQGDFENDEDYLVKVSYSGKPKVAKRPPWEGGVVWKKDKAGKPWCSIACENEGSWTWLPIKGYLGDEPDSVRTHFIVPAGLQCISNGIFLGEEKLDDKWTKFNWKISYPINPYNITFYLGTFEKIQMPYLTADKQQINLDFYVLPINLEKAKSHFKQTDSILKIYEELFGPYPWPKDGFKLVESPFAGMEHQSGIAYGNGYKNETGESYDYIILHESAHEWWGNAVSVSDFADIWIHEGMATFSEALYVEKTKGKKAYYDYIWFQGVGVMNRAPVILPPEVYYWNYKDGDVYVKGSVIMNTLRNFIANDTIFLNALKEFNMIYRYKNVVSADFFNFIQTKTKKDLKPFIYHYFYKRESPQLVWNFTTNQEGKDIFVCFFERVDKDFTLPVTIEQNGKYYTVEVNSIEKSIIELPDNTNISINKNYSYFQMTRRNSLDDFKK